VNTPLSWWYFARQRFVTFIRESLFYLFIELELVLIIFLCPGREDNCTGGKILPIPVPLPAGALVVNPLDITQVVAATATCTKVD